MNKALVLFAHGKGFALAWQGDEHVDMFVHDMGGSSEGFDCDQVDFRDPGDGLFVCDLKIVKDGNADYWTGEQDYMLALADLRPATAEEWAAHRRAEWPWPQIDEDLTPLVPSGDAVL